MIPFLETKCLRQGLLRAKAFVDQVISYRQLHVLDETYVMNGCKEDCCYVAKDFDAEMVKAKNNLVARDYVLPDFTAIRRQETSFFVSIHQRHILLSQGFHEDCRGVQWEAWRGGTIGIIQCSSFIIKTSSKGHTYI